MLATPPSARPSRPRQGSLYTKIIGWSFVPTAIILIAVAWVTFYAYQRVTEDLVIERNRELARLSASQLATGLREYADPLNSLARVAAIYSGDPLAQSAALQQARNRLVAFDAGVVVLDHLGRVVAAAPDRPEILGLDWSGRAYFRQMIHAPGPAFSDVVVDGPEGDPVVVIAAPIIGPQGEFVGALAGMVRLGATAISPFYAGILRLRLGESGAFYLVDGRGTVIYHSDAGRVGENFADRPVVQRVLAGQIGNLRARDGDGEDLLASFAPVPGASWGLVSEEKWSTLMNPSQGYRRFLLILLALGVIVPAIVVTVGVGRIMRPINEMIRAAQAVAAGRFGQTIVAQTDDELEELATQFNRMSARLQESYATLERKVADRTRELATLNAIAMVVSRSLDLRDVLQDALAKTLEAMAMEGGSAFRIDGVGERPAGQPTLTLMAHQGLSADIVEHLAHLQWEGSAMEQAAHESQPVVREAAAYTEGPFKDGLIRAGWRLVVSVPLMAKGRTLGAINLVSRTRRAVTPDEFNLLAAIGQQVGVAVENARLYEEAERAAAAAERSRLARELHDAVTQTLFSASLIADVLPRLWERNPDEGRRRLTELRQLTRGALAEMRALLLELRPSALADANLPDLLRQLAEAATGRARIAIQVDVQGGCSLPPDVQIALYRIAQEALNNVARHSGASAASVCLRLPPAADAVELTIADDGRGFATAAAGDHFGLDIMQERAQAIGATLHVDSAPGQGTRVTVVWPAPTPARP